MGWPACWDVHGCVTLAGETPDEPRDVRDGFGGGRPGCGPTPNGADLPLAAGVQRRNTGRAGVGWFGVDVYSTWESIRAVIDSHMEYRPDYVDAALRAFAVSSRTTRIRWPMRGHQLVPDGCADDVIALLRRVAAGTEHYYRSMGGGPDSWNVRDGHMTDTVDRLLAFHSEQARTAVWAHSACR